VKVTDVRLAAISCENSFGLVQLVIAGGEPTILLVYVSFQCLPVREQLAEYILLMLSHLSGIVPGTDF